MKTLAFIAIPMLLTICGPAASQGGAGADVDALRSHDSVLALQPVGYWPADEGAGEVLHDRSGNDNHGKLINTRWRDGLLDFSSDVYQWAQIPHHPTYASRAFTVGGWAFSRRTHITSRVLLIGQPWVSGPSGYRWVGWGGRQQADGVLLRFGAASEDPGHALVEVVSGAEVDALSAAGDKVAMAINAWQHVLYAYDESGVGRLYLNGRLVRTASEVPFKPAETPLVVGGDLEQWAVWPIDGRSLDGSVRDIVVFDRALAPTEVESLYRSTKPQLRPAEPGQDVDAEPQALPLLLQTLQDDGLPYKQHAEAALSLSAMGEDAVAAVPALVEALEAILKSEGARLPRIEDILRNAIMRALLDIAPEEPAARDVLGRAFAEPILASLDLTKPYLADIRPLVEAGRYMDALDAYRAHLQSVPKLPGHRYWGHACADDVRASLPLREEYSDAYLSKGNPFSDAPYRPNGCRPADYTPVDVHDEHVYMTVVERLSQAQAEAEYQRSLRDLATTSPATDAKWSRVRIIRIGAEGNEQDAPLEGDWFIFDAQDAKMDGWAVGVDRDGYVHVIGGQHNSPNRANYIPGSWEKMGIAPGDGRPGAMYWVSTDPGDISSFEFVGQRGSARGVPCGWMNYMNFARSPDGTLFLYGRDHIWTWGLYRYDANARRWTGLGGSTTAMLDRAKTTVPGWSDRLGETVPRYGPTPARVLVGAWQPGAYNFNRSSWGVRFDRTGRMHVQMGIWGVGENGRMTNGPVYAYSDNLGDTFHRVDGTRLKLPLTVNPVPGHHADMAFHSTRQWFDLWTSLLRHAGYSTP